MKKLTEIKPYVRNPRENDITVDKLVKIIPQVGFNVPLVLDKNGIIVKGHARFRAGIRLGMEEFPCIISEASDEQNKLDRISDNRVSEFSEWVMDALKEELDGITMDTSDLEMMVDEPVEVVQEAEEAEAKEEAELTLTAEPKKFIKVICEKCGHVQFVENNKNVTVGHVDREEEPLI